MAVVLLHEGCGESQSCAHITAVVQDLVTQGDVDLCQQWGFVILLYGVDQRQDFVQDSVQQPQ